MNELPQVLRQWLAASADRCISRSPHRSEVTLICFPDGTRKSRTERTFANVEDAAQAVETQWRPEHQRARAAPYRLLGDGAADLSGAAPMPVRF